MNVCGSLAQAEHAARRTRVVYRVHIRYTNTVQTRLIEVHSPGTPWSSSTRTAMTVVS